MSSVISPYILSLIMGINISKLNRVIEDEYLNLFLKPNNRIICGIWCEIISFTDISRAMTSRSPCTSLQQTTRVKSRTLPTLFLNSFVICYTDKENCISVRDFCFSACSNILFFQNNNVKRASPSRLPSFHTSERIFGLPVELT